MRRIIQFKLKSIRQVILGFMVLFGGNSFAHTTAQIESILLYEGGNLIYVYPKGGVQNPPPCHGSNGNYLSFKMNRPMSKEYLSALMMAFVAQKTVTFYTANDCIDQNVSETINYFLIHNG